MAFTKKELVTAARKAYAGGDTAGAKRIAQMIQALPPESPMTTGPLGKATQFVDDTVRVGTDSLTRGYADKVLGDQAQADTRASRERLPDYVELPADIAGSLVGSPYRVGSALVGGVAGGLEGMANEYGHQQDWIPSPSDLVDIGYEGVKGAALGSGLAKVGQKVGDWWSGKAAERAKKYPTDQALNTDIARLLYKNPQSKKAAALQDRADRVKAARAAQEEGREAFEGLKPGKNKAAEAAAKKIAEGGSGKTADALKTGGKVLAGRSDNVLANMPAAGLNFATGGWSGGAGLAIEGLGEMLSRRTQIPAKEMEAFTSLIREGGDLKDPKYVNAMRDMLAKLGVGAAKSPSTPDWGKSPLRNTFGGPR